MDRKIDVGRQRPEKERTVIEGRREKSRQTKGKIEQNRRFERQMEHDSDG